MSGPRIDLISSGWSGFTWLHKLHYVLLPKLIFLHYVLGHSQSPDLSNVGLLTPLRSGLKFNNFFESIPTLLLLYYTFLI